ncbi:MAG: hypothetical protein AUJ75_02355 [Candidatus Omnitrophica bacterium CG1_02_49_10]|nr:MAG: hypothetical protein AUJ75_02355 [Candidatus Omnitrophica bacterium CG1_02_49_10]
MSRLVRCGKILFDNFATLVGIKFHHFWLGELWLNVFRLVRYEEILFDNFLILVGINSHLSLMFALRAP